MTTMLLAEEIFLLTHADESGKSDGTLALDNGFAGALLLDLAAQELLAAAGKVITAVPGTASHPLLSAAHTAVLTSDKPRTAQHWVSRLPAALKPLGSQIGQSLAEARAKDIARESATAEATSAAVSSSVQAVQASIMMAVLIPTIMVTTTG